MIANPVTEPPISGNQFLSKIKKLGFCLILIGILLVFLFIIIFFVGQQEIHEGNKHLLYDSFEQSPEHVALMKKLQKNKLSIVYGNSQGGLFNFIEHFSNKLSLAGKTVYVEQFGQDSLDLYQVVKSARVRLDSLLGIDQEDGDWIILSLNGQIIPQKFINQVKEQNPNSRIIIATTSKKQQNSDFKFFQYPDMEEHEIQESIERNFKVSQNTADILYDYFGNPANIYLNMDIEAFDHQEFLGENYRPLDDLDKEDIRILKDLCKKGEGNSKVERPKLTSIGVVFYEGDNYWLDAASRLNYELHKGLNCKNKLIPESVLREMQQEKERLLQQARLEQVKKSKEVIQKQQRQPEKELKKKKSKK